MALTVRARAPAKIILMGEHAAAHGCPALATTVGLYCNVWVWPRTDEQIELQLPDLPLHRFYLPREVFAYTQKVRQAWGRYRDNPCAELFARVRGVDKDHLIKCAIGEVLCCMEARDWRGFSLRVESAIPLNAGFGSSGALAVALMAALSQMFKLFALQHPLEPLAFALERFQHGQPSGIDHNTSLLGGTVEQRPVVNGSYRLISWPANALSFPARTLDIYHTGSAHESTGQIIAATRHRLEGRGNTLLANMRHCAEHFCLLLRQSQPQPETLKYLIREYQACLERLGVVPNSIANVIRSIEQVGGAAKICGAGALSGEQAGALMVVDAPSMPGLEGFERIDAPLTVAGLKVSSQ